MNHTLVGQLLYGLENQWLKQLIEQKGYTGIILGVRADEEGTRAKERYFSPRDKHGDGISAINRRSLGSIQDDFSSGTHIRIHPLLD